MSELGPLPEPEASFHVDANGNWIEGKNGTGMFTAGQMRSYAQQEVEKERERWQAVIFDGYRVLQSLDEKAKKRTSGENVSDVLDAVARLLKA